jgi:hypothetical protein
MAPWRRLSRGGGGGNNVGLGRAVLQAMCRSGGKQTATTATTTTIQCGGGGGEVTYAARRAGVGAGAFSGEIRWKHSAASAANVHASSPSVLASAVVAASSLSPLAVMHVHHAHHHHRQRHRQRAGSLPGSQQWSFRSLACSASSSSSSSSDHDDAPASRYGHRRSQDGTLRRSQAEEDVMEYPQRPGRPECAFYVENGAW